MVTMHNHVPVEPSPDVLLRMLALEGPASFFTVGPAEEHLCSAVHAGSGSCSEPPARLQGLPVQVTAAFNLAPQGIQNDLLFNNRTQEFHLHGEPFRQTAPPVVAASGSFGSSDSPLAPFLLARAVTALDTVMPRLFLTRPPLVMPLVSPLRTSAILSAPGRCDEERQRVPQDLRQASTAPQT